MSSNLEILKELVLKKINDSQNKISNENSLVLKDEIDENTYMGIYKKTGLLLKNLYGQMDLPTYEERNTRRDLKKIRKYTVSKIRTKFDEDKTSKKKGEIKKPIDLVLKFVLDFLEKKDVYYFNKEQFRQTFILLDDLLKQMDVSNYEKGKIIRLFLSIPFNDEIIEDSLFMNKNEAFLEFSKIRKMSLARFVSSLIRYHNNPDTITLSSGLKRDIKKFLDKMEEDKMTLKSKYETFQSKCLTVSTNYDFEGMERSLDELTLSQDLINIYSVYCKEIYDKKQMKLKPIVIKEEKKEVLESKIYTKKELKNELLKYCDLKSDKPFDYHNYKKVLELLKKLQFADNINERYFNYCNINMVENNAYYNMLFNKIKNKKEYADIVDRVYSIREKMFICSEEEYDAYLKEIFQVLDMVGKMEMLNFDYEMARVRK